MWNYFVIFSDRGNFYFFRKSIDLFCDNIIIDLLVHIIFFSQKYHREAVQRWRWKNMLRQPYQI